MYGNNVPGTENPEETTYYKRRLETPGVTVSKSEREELALILQSLHSEDRDEFRNSISKMMTSDEWDSIQTAEQSGMLMQAVSVFEHIVKQRLPLSFAEIVGWRIPSGLAQVIEPTKNILPKLRVVTLKLSHSRGLNGHVAFRVIRDVARVTSSFPQQALTALADAKEHSYFRQIVYLEPLFHKGLTLRSQKSVQRFKRPRPIDPILAGFLGSGPPGYGYNLKDPHVREQLRCYHRENYVPFTAFLIAHWD